MPTSKQKFHSKAGKNSKTEKKPTAEKDIAIQAESEQGQLVVKVLKGADLRREPNRNPKTKDGKDNVILSLPFRTVVLLVVSDTSLQDDGEGHQWILVRPENGNVDKTGWVDLNCLIPQIMTKGKVIAPQGTDFRREPTLEAKTKDGIDNVILSLPTDTHLVILELPRDVDGSSWCLVLPEIDKNEEIGWVVLEDIEGPFGGGIAAAPAEDTYTFQYDQKQRTITKANLDSAIGGKLSTTKLTGLEFSITLNKSYQKEGHASTATYWTTKKNLKEITMSPKVE
jgi:hypothetical protein